MGNRDMEVPRRVVQIGHGICKGPGVGAWCVQRRARGGGGKGSVRTLREVIREVRGQGMDLALTLGRREPGAFEAQERMMYNSPPYPQEIHSKTPVDASVHTYLL